MHYLDAERRSIKFQKSIVDHLTKIIVRYTTDRNRSVPDCNIS